MYCSYISWSQSTYKIYEKPRTVNVGFTGFPLSYKQWPFFLVAKFWPPNRNRNFAKENLSLWQQNTGTLHMKKKQKRNYRMCNTKRNYVNAWQMLGCDKQPPSQAGRLKQYCVIVLFALNQNSEMLISLQMYVHTKCRQKRTRENSSV